MKAILALALCLTAQAETPDSKIIQEALSQTQALMNDPVLRSEVIAKDPKAGAADAQLKSVMGTPEGAAQAYTVASEIMEVLVKQYGGDPSKMEAALEQAQKDPGAFLQALPEAQRQKIRALAGEVEARTPRH